MLHALFEICRRLLWFLAVVLALSIVTFALAPAPTLSTSLPRFINSEPKSLHQYAWTLAQSVAATDSSSAWSAYELGRLGAVALPHVLPKLDSLPPEGRLRVLLALEPVAKRMGLTHSKDNVSQLSSTWLAFLSDNAVYLHPAMAKRLVARFVDDPTAQHARDLRRLDTFAVPELVQALNSSLNLGSSYERTRNIVEVLRQVTGHDATWSLPPADAPRLKAYDSVIEKWRGWWFAERHLYETATSTSHLTAPLLQTQFALWVRDGAGAWMDRGLESAIGTIPWLALTRSVFLFLFAIFGGTALARLFSQRVSNERTRAVLRNGLSLLGLLPIALVAGWAHRAAIHGMLIAAPVVALFGAALTQRRQPRKADSKTHQSDLPALGSTYTATLLCACLVVEWGLRVDGLGPLVVDAIKHADATPVLCVALVNTLLIGIVQYLTSRRAAQST